MQPHPLFGLSVPERGWVPAPRYVLRRDRVLKLVPPLAPGRLLEIGPGAGALLADLAALGFDCVGLETSPAAAELARYVHRHQPQVLIASQPAADWSQAFDVVVSFEVLEHIADDEAALGQWREWLKPGGRLVLSVPARARLWSTADVAAGHYRRYERQDLVLRLGAAGFEVEHLECYGFPLSNLILPLRARSYRRQLRERRGEPLDQQAQTALSGIFRRTESRLYGLQTSRPGVWLFRLGFWLQERCRNYDWGTGYLVVAGRR